MCITYICPSCKHAFCTTYDGFCPHCKNKKYQYICVDCYESKLPLYTLRQYDSFQSCSICKKDNVPCGIGTYYEYGHHQIADKPIIINTQTDSYGRIQWKGTDVCVDLHCNCGFSGHFDGDFMYFLLCPKCKKYYMAGAYIKLIELKAKPDQDIIIMEE